MTFLCCQKRRVFVVHASVIPLARLLWAVACVLLVVVAAPAAHPSARSAHHGWALEQALAPVYLQLRSPRSLFVLLWWT